MGVGVGPRAIPFLRVVCFTKILHRRPDGAGRNRIGCISTCPQCLTGPRANPFQHEGHTDVNAILTWVIHATVCTGRCRTQPSCDAAAWYDRVDYALHLSCRVWEWCPLGFTQCVEHYSEAAAEESGSLLPHAPQSVDLARAIVPQTLGRVRMAE